MDSGAGVTNERVVVGVDGSAAASSALSWAAQEARLRGAELVACIVVEESRAAGSDADSVPSARCATPELTGGYPLTLRHVVGDTAAELVAASADADLLVVGSRGRGRVGSLLGSVSRACVARASCPVVVVRQPPRGETLGRVIVGVDGSVHAREALLLAAEEAGLRGVVLQVLHAVFWDNAGTELTTPTPRQLWEWGRKLVEAELAATGVSGEPTVVAGHPGKVLVRVTDEADLLVLGTRAPRPALSLLLGSVLDQCLRHGSCPVMVTRADRRHRHDESAPRSPEGVK